MQTFTSRDYLKIDIASNYGLDKKSWDYRINWFNEHEDHLMEMLVTADEPALFYAGVQAWHKTLAGEPTGYMISLDATSSGLQLLACLTGDRKAAQICNVLDTGEREDAYTQVYSTMLKEIDEEAKIERDEVKSAVMCSLYGSKAMPKQIFGEGALLDLFYKTMAEMAPAAWELNEAFLAIWDKEALSNDWVLPDNFHVHVKVMDQVKETVHFLNEPFDIFRIVNQPIENGRSLGANCTHSIDGMIVREVTRRCNYNLNQVNKLKEFLLIGSSNKSTLTEDDNLVVILWNHYISTGYLSARILDHLNMNNLGHVDQVTIQDLISSLPKKPFQVVSIHDAFRCHANYGNDLRWQYANQLMMIARSNLLSSIISQIIKRPVVLGKMDPEMYVEILNSNYALS